MNFQMTLMPKVILAKFLSQKITLLEHSYLKYALDKTFFLLHDFLCLGAMVSKKLPQKFRCSVTLEIFLCPLTIFTILQGLQV